MYESSLFQPFKNYSLFFQIHNHFFISDKESYLYFIFFIFDSKTSLSHEFVLYCLGKRIPTGSNSLLGFIKRIDESSLSDSLGFYSRNRHFKRSINLSRLGFIRICAKLIVSLSIHSANNAEYSRIQRENRISMFKIHAHYQVIFKVEIWFE